MVKKYSIIIGIIISQIFLFVSTLFYPGGSQHDINSVGYDWKNNYLSNLFGEKAVNGSDNPARIWAVGGMFLLSISFALFFIQFSKRIPDKKSAKIIKYSGAFAMLFAFLAVTPYHDTMIMIADTLALLSIFYITVFTFKTKLHFSKILSVICLLFIYGCTYIYYTSSYLEILPIMQKTSLAINMIWILWFEYLTRTEDFQHIKLAKTNRGEKATNG